MHQESCPWLAWPDAMTHTCHHCSTACRSSIVIHVPALCQGSSVMESKVRPTSQGQFKPLAGRRLCV